jgi:hypothetical protein
MPRPALGCVNTFLLTQSPEAAAFLQEKILNGDGSHTAVTSVGTLLSLGRLAKLTRLVRGLKRPLGKRFTDGHLFVGRSQGASFAAVHRLCYRSVGRLHPLPNFRLTEEFRRALSERDAAALRTETRRMVRSAEARGLKVIRRTLREIKNKTSTKT